MGPIPPCCRIEVGFYSSPHSDTQCPQPRKVYGSLRMSLLIGCSGTALPLFDTSANALMIPTRLQEDDRIPVPVIRM